MDVTSNWHKICEHIQILNTKFGRFENHHAFIVYIID